MQVIIVGKIALKYQENLYYKPESESQTFYVKVMGESSLCITVKPSRFRRNGKKGSWRPKLTLSFSLNLVKRNFSGTFTRREKRNSERIRELYQRKVKVSPMKSCFW